MKKFLIAFLLLILCTILPCSLTACKKEVPNKQDSNKSCSHEYEEWAIIKHSTCIETGIKERTCSLCGNIESEITESSEIHKVESDGFCSVCEEEIYTEGLLFSLLADKYIVTDYIGSKSTVIIPDKYENLPVTGIDYKAFSDCAEITSITIPDSVTNIGYYAFSGCTGLTSINIPDSVTFIGGSAFHETAYYNNESNWESGVLYIGNHLIEAKPTISVKLEIKSGTKTIAAMAFQGCDKLTSITIPDSVTNIVAHAFSDFIGLTNIVIPDSVTKIGADAFSGCTSLTSVTIGNSVESIDVYAFSDCTELTSITIPYSVKDITYSAFFGCKKLTSITVDPNNKTYHSNGNCIIETATKTLIIGIKSSIIPTDGSVTNIGSYAFQHCAGLTSITIPTSVTNIDHYAFLGCTELTSITIPDSVTFIGVSAFRETAYYNNNSNWENGVLYIGNHLIEAKPTISGKHEIKSGTKAIAAMAFQGCNKLTSVTIPDSVVSIGYLAFSRYAGLDSITFRGTKAQWDTISKNEEWMAGTEYTIHCTDGDITKSES